MIGTALRLWALADPQLAADLGERLRPDHLEHGDELANVAAIYSTISETPGEGLVDDTEHSEERIQFDIFGTNSTTVRQVAKKLRKRLRLAIGSLPAGDQSVYCTGVSTAGGIRDLSPMQPIDGGAIWKHRRSFDVFVGFSDEDS
jgi:hypothetical protein